MVNSKFEAILGRKKYFGISKTRREAFVVILSFCRRINGEYLAATHDCFQYIIISTCTQPLLLVNRTAF
jgi:hypothetical protein